MLENLSPKQAIEIAKIAYSNIDWVCCTPFGRKPWKGIDLIDKESDPQKFKHNFQIDYRECEEAIRFRYYDDAYKQTIVSDEVKQKIYDYIKTLNL